MKRKAVWVFISCLMVTSLVLASCAPAPATPTTPTRPAAPAAPTAPAPATPVTPATPSPAKETAPEVPRYGGSFTKVSGASILGFDEAYRISYGDYPMNLTNQELLRGDWTKGPAGSGETLWDVNVFSIDLVTGGMAETFEVPDERTLIFHIRQGVRWHDKPPVNGREMTANDVAFTIKYVYQDTQSYNRLSAPGGYAVESITVPDKWTVVVKVPGLAAAFLEDMGDKMHVIPPEVIAQYRDMKDWRNSVGTGPFVLKDYVVDSALTFVKHGNYWMKDPVGPGKGNQLPYIDGVKWLIIADASTRSSALRTGKIDQLAGLRWDEAGYMKKTNPELKWSRYLQLPANPVFMRIDKPELPFKDIRVRRALHMAVDLRGIKDLYYGGEAELLVHPVPPQYKGMYIPLDELPQSVRELWDYNPKKAKKLLAEAGYPNGFETEILILTSEVDLLSIFAADWAKIGVKLNLDVREYGVWNSITAARTHKAMSKRYSGDFMPGKFFALMPDFIHNQSMINDPVVNKTYAEVQVNLLNTAERDRLIKEMVPYYLDQAYNIQPPTPYAYNFWQPWVKNYRGELSVGYYGYDWPALIWVDQDLKQKMRGR